MRAASKDSQGRNLASQETGIFGLQAGEDVNEAYRRDMDADFACGGPMSQAVRNLAARVMAGERLVAMCHCIPRSCHGEVILERVRELCGDSTHRH